MRHRRGGYRLGRTTAHRASTLRNIAAALFEHGQITTTIPKAKAVQPMVEKIIGTPILAWPAELEDIGRLMALAAVVGIATVMSAIVAASLFVDVDRHRYARIAWIGWSLMPTLA